MKATIPPTHTYHIFGMTIDSSLPFLDMPESDGPPDVTIKYGTVPHGITDAKIKGFRYQAGPEELLLKIDDVASFYVAKGTEITIERHPKAADQEVQNFIINLDKNCFPGVSMLKAGWKTRRSGLTSACSGMRI